MEWKNIKKRHLQGATFVNDSQEENEKREKETRGGKTLLWEKVEYNRYAT